jgi:hypothetical protein
MRYVLIHSEGSPAASIWPQTLRGLNAALKEAIKISQASPESTITLSIHSSDEGRRAPIKKFRGGQEIWSSGMSDGDGES